jgi:diguanylate cyclase (GGDEF)-like protein
VVQDGPEQATVARELLAHARASAEIVEAASPGDALERLLDMRRPELDAIVLVVRRGDPHPLDALARLRVAAIDVPVLVLLDADDEALALRATREGAQDVLVAGDDQPRIGRALRLAAERMRREAALARRALHDPLTGLPNRALLADRLAHALGRLGRTDGCLAVIFLDIDDFKAVNDHHGHAAGDAVLVEVGARLADALRGGDTAARVGGDEFVVLCEDVSDEDEARAIARRLLGVLDRRASMGVALACHGGARADALVRAADAAMYAVKRRGGAGFELAPDGPPVAAP